MKKFQLRDDVVIKTPRFHESVFIAEGARVIGDVVIGKDSSVWYNCVLRGDINQIVIGERSNIQDGTIIHLENDLGCVVGNDVVVGHGAILHACTIEDGALIGMGAIILNGAIIRKGAVVGAGAVVTEGMEVPENSLTVGVPAKVIKKMPDDSYDTTVKWAEKYIKLAGIHKAYSRGFAANSES
jgi:carbonic anhydrase/acetyltransferase-like protein (isoleucine patch superfamily)